MDATRRLLLVEDDTLLRMTLAELLTDAGFAVIEASDAESALEHAVFDLNRDSETV